MKIAIFGVPLDLGANVRGSRYAPDRIREFLLPVLKKRSVDFEDLPTLFSEFFYSCKDPN